MFCARCGNQVPDGDRVCTHCGANLLELFAVRSTPLDAGEDPTAPNPWASNPTASASAPDAPTISTPRLSDSQVWDRFMRPATGRTAASHDTGSDTGTQPLPLVDDATRALPGATTPDAMGEGPDEGSAARQPVDHTRVMDPLEIVPGAAFGSPAGSMPAQPGSASATTGVTPPVDATVDDLPPEWFRGATAIDPRTGTTPPRPVSSPATQRTSTSLGAMIEPASGRPPAPGQRRRHERLSAAGVAALVCVPVALLAVFVGRYLNDHHGQQVIHTVATATTVRTVTAPPTSAVPSAASTATASPTSVTSAPTTSGTVLAGVPTNATACSDTVWAAVGTSCPFAQVVADAVAANSAQDFQVQATSPTTGGHYTMDCSRTAGLATCTGGRAAAVYVRVG